MKQFVRGTRRVAGRGGRRLLAGTLAMASLPLMAEKPPVPTARLTLESLGFPGYTTALMHAGASMATIHLLDSEHLLFTYSLRTLVPRLVGDDAGDSDRVVAAEIVDISSGKVVERTQWHLHDHGRYLWSLGQGLFLVRIGDDLSTFAPLHGLGDGTAFERTAVAHRPGQPIVVSASADGAVVTVELQHAKEPAEEDGAPENTAKHKRTTLEFYRVMRPREGEGRPRLMPAGAVGAPGLLRLALDGDGYLWAEDVQRNRWNVSFNEFQGKPQELTALDSTCSPRMELLSRSQFLAMSCRGSDGAQRLAVYGFDGHETWEEPVGDSLDAPLFVSAPEAGRFAMSRLSANGGGSGISGLGPGSGMDDNLSTQEIRVYGTESGDLLFHLSCAPVVRTAENFDLSPDGRTVAVLGKSAIELYRLPALSARDRKELGEVQAMAPPVANGPVVLTRITRPVGEERRRLVDEPPAGPAAGAEADAAGARAQVPAVGAKTAAVEPAPQPDLRRAANTAGDAPAEAPRQKPTLLSPGETPEFKGKPDAPQ